MSQRDLAGLVTSARSAAPSREAAGRALRLVDLTSLRGDETEVEIDRLCARAVEHGVAAVCIHARFLHQAKPRLAGSAVRLAAVANFPHGGDDILEVADEAAAAFADGADEIDVVAPIGAILDGDISIVGELVEACRTAVGAGTTLKLILETGVLSEPELIGAAARAGVMAGADFLKTSTGKAAVGATLEAAAVLLTVCAEADGRVGFKAAGGIRTTADAAGYLGLADLMLGADWATPATFRLGASSLLDDLLATLGRGPGASASGGY